MFCVARSRLGWEEQEEQSSAQSAQASGTSHNVIEAAEELDSSVHYLTTTAIYLLLLSLSFSCGHLGAVKKPPRYVRYSGF